MLRFLRTSPLHHDHGSLRRIIAFSGMVLGLLTGCSGQPGTTKVDEREALRRADSTLNAATRSGVPALCSLLHDPTFMKRSMAAYELGSMETDAAVAMENTWRAGRMPEHPNGPDALECLLRATNDSMRSVRAFTATAIGNFPGVRSSDALKEQLQRENDPEVRKRLLTAIGSVYVPANAAFLAAQGAPTLADSMGVVLGAKNMAIADLDSPELIARCVDMLRASADATLQRMILGALTKADTASLASHADTLLQLARTGPSQSSFGEAWCALFARVPGEKSLAFLKEAANGGSASVRSAARAALAARGGRP
jgi:hypothetical protein